MRKITTFLLCAGLAFLFACRDDRYLPTLQEEGVVDVQIQIRTNGYKRIDTRAMDENAIGDVTLLQFKGGLLVKKIELGGIDGSGIVNPDGLIAMPTATCDNDGNLLPDGNENVLVCLANFYEKFSGVLTAMKEGSTTYSDLPDHMVTLSGAAELAGLTYIPMVGYYCGGLKGNEFNQVSVSLVRTMARVDFTLNTERFLHEGSPVDIMVNAIELRNVPTVFTLFAPTDRSTYPVAEGEGDDAIGTDAENFITLGEDYNLTAGDKLNSFTAYMPANARGNYPAITRSADKHPGTVGAPNDKGWTHIYVDINFITRNSYVKNATYKIYLGGDNLGDINILAGTQYDITTNLLGANDSDTRIEVDIVSVPILEPANCYIVNRSMTDKAIVMPLSQAEAGWQFIQERLGGGNYVTDLNALLADPGKWEVATLWRTWNTDAVVTGTPKTGMMGLDGQPLPGYFVSLNGLGDVPEGNNGVIALRSTADHNGYPAGTIWWTWHLWFTDYNPDLPESDEEMNGQLHTYISDAFRIGGLYYMKKMMDRNLGATITGIANTAEAAQPQEDDGPKYYGMMYQWGRKDPFTPSASGTGSVFASDAVPIYGADGIRIQYSGFEMIGQDVYGNSIIAETNSMDGFPKFYNHNYNRLADAVRYPFVYFYYTNQPHDWTRTDDNLWQTGVKTAFDPCPPGWRVPAGGETAADNPWAGFSNGNGSSTEAVNNGTTIFVWMGPVGINSGQLYDGPDANGEPTKAWYPAPGYRYVNRGGTFYNVGHVGFLWTASVMEHSSYEMNYSYERVGPAGIISRANAMSVRCVCE